MTKTYGIVLSSAITWLLATGSLCAQISFTELPEDLQFYPRDLDTNDGTVRFAGTASSSGILQVVVSRDGIPWKTRTWDVSGDFSKSLTIPAERSAFDVSVSFNGTPVAAIDSVAAGDVIVAHGQSNATAYSHDGVSANAYRDPYVRAYGVQFAWDSYWLRAEGDKNSVIAANVGSVGQWALKLARDLSHEVGIPVAVLNGSRTGKAIRFFLRDDADPGDTGTNYGRLLTRANNAGVREDIRAFVWYQGESDTIDETPITTYADRFDDLYDDWVDDYPGLEAIYMMQIRTCGDVEALELQEWQRQRVGDPNYPILQVVSANGLSKYSDRCHYTKVGHDGLANRLFPLMLRDLYGQNPPGEIESPNVDVAGIVSPSTLNIRLTGDHTIAVHPDAASLFILEGTSATVSTVIVAPSKTDAANPVLVLTLDGNGESITHVSYTGYQEAGVCHEISNANGIGLLAFHNVPVQQDLLPIELTDFTASTRGNTVYLQWKTASPASGFEIQQADNGLWDTLGFVEGNTSEGSVTYGFEVSGLSPGVHRYRLRMLDLDGEEHYSEELEVFLEGPGSFSLTELYPNPSAGYAAASVTSHIDGLLQITLLDLLGRRKRVVFQGEIRKDETMKVQIHAGELPAGMYVLSADVGGLRQIRHLKIIR